MSQQFMAGVGRADVSPSPGIAQGGWGAQLHQRSRGNDVPLEARALALSSGSERVAIVDLDAIGFDIPTTEKIIGAIEKLTGLTRHQIRFSCTHTHSGPNTFRLPMIREGLDMVLSYLDALPNQIAGAVWQALNNRRPARVGVSIGSCDINVNRRCQTPDGKTFVGCNETVAADRTVAVLRFDNEVDGTPLAAVLHYACHPTTMAWQIEHVTPDYPGRAKQVVEESLGAPCLFLQGAAGDLGPRTSFSADLADYRRLGTILGLEAAKLAWNTDTIPTRLVLKQVQESGSRNGIYERVRIPQPPPVLRVISKSIPLPLRPQPDPDELLRKAEQLRTELNKVRSSGSEQEVRDATAQATRAGMAAERATLYFGQTSIPWPMQGIAIGDTALVSVAGEPFSEIGICIRERSPYRHTLVSGYSNGGFGYIPVRKAFPQGGYEVETTPFSEDAADALVEAALRMLEDLKRMQAG